VRIKQISVTELFGLFNHIIPLNTEEHITIIHGLNGFGKTTLLKMLYALFSSNYLYADFQSIPFKEFRVDFDDNSTVCVHKTGISSNGKRDETTNFALELNFSSSTLEWSLPLKPLEENDLPFQLDEIDSIVPELDQIGPRTWRNILNSERYSLEEVLRLYSDDLPLILNNRQDKGEYPEESWEILRRSVHVHLIETEGLLKLKQNRGKRTSAAKRPSIPSTLEYYFEELAFNIQATLADYAEESQKLDRSFPTRLVKQSQTQILSQEELNTKLVEFELKRGHLIKIGLLDKDQTDQTDLQLTKEEIEKSDRKVLSVYVNDIEKKLAIFDEMAAKIDLFLKFVDDHFLFKKLEISKEEGFVFIITEGTSKGLPLELTGLSSGEQHELALLYQLLFKLTAGSLILIDEPETSLHVAWQMQFLQDLQDVIKLVDFDALIATHSPEIINDRWDLTVGLKGPTDEN
jgi:predicted ATP-binding protein involved in virulence